MYFTFKLTSVNLPPLTNNVGIVSLIAHRYKDTDLKVTVTLRSNNASSLGQVQKYRADTKIYAPQPGRLSITAFSTDGKEHEMNKEIHGQSPQSDAGFYWYHQTCCIFWS